ncbi:MAG: hypothetical protein COB02_14405 [Candidatus Cloacimonadota bacterium]|nr:MAG: hypothetical protein COB02_14405 [Candidatus Cloacimonadota bacterium]
MSSNKLLDLLEVILCPHFDFLPDILKSPKKDLIHSSILLISDLKSSKFDDLVVNKENLKDYFESCIKVIKKKPKPFYATLLTSQIFNLPIGQQIEILSSFKGFDKAQDFTKFLLKEHSRFETHIKKDMLATLADLGENDGLEFVVDILSDLSREDESFILGKMINFSCKFSKQQTQKLKSRFKECEGLDLKAQYLRLMSQGDLEVSYSTIMGCLQKQSDLVVNAAIQSLIYLKREGQISDSLLDIYANSNDFGLTISVVEVLAKKYEKSKSDDDLKKALKIISNLLNHESFEARIVAVRGAKLFSGDARVLDWISSLLLSETREEIIHEVLGFLKNNHEDKVKNVLMKVCDRHIDFISKSAIDLLAEFEDISLFDFYNEILNKNKENVALVSSCVMAMAKSVPLGKEEIYQVLLGDENVEVQRAALLGLRYWPSEDLRSYVERNYQSYSGRNRSVAAFILFLGGIAYVLDDLRELISTESAVDQRVAIQAISEIYNYIRNTPVELVYPIVIENLEIWFRDHDFINSSNGVVDDVLFEYMIKVRAFCINKQWRKAHQFISKLGEKYLRNFFIQMASVYVEKQMEQDIDTEQCLRLIAQDETCMLTFEVLSYQYKRLKKGEEFLLTKLHQQDVKYKYYRQFIEMLTAMPKSMVQGPVFRKVLKIIQEGTLPDNVKLHYLLSQIFIKTSDFTNAYKHLIFGYLTILSDAWYGDIVSTCLKLGEIDKAIEIIDASKGLLTDEKQILRFKKIEEKVREIKR